MPRSRSYAMAQDQVTGPRVRGQEPTKTHRRSLRRLGSYQVDGRLRCVALLRPLKRSRPHAIPKVENRRGTLAIDLADFAPHGDLSRASPFHTSPNPCAPIWEGSVRSSRPKQGDIRRGN